MAKHQVLEGMISLFLSKIPKKINFDSATVYLEPTPSTDYLNLLDQTIWGTSGPKYYFYNSANKIEDLQPALFCSYYYKDKLAAIFTITIRYDSKENLLILYGKHYSCDKNISKGAGVRLILALRDTFTSLELPFLFHAYVDKENHLSQNVIKRFELKRWTGFKTYNFSRVKPKSNLKLEKVQKLRSYFHDHLFYNNHLRKVTDKIVFENGSHCETYHNHWKILYLPGTLGWMAVKIFPHLPLINRLINSNKFEFVSLIDFNDTFFTDSRAESQLESLLCYYKVNNLILWINEKDPLNTKLGNLKWGLIQQLNEVKSTDVFVFSHLIESSRLEQLKSRTIYVNAFDIG